MTGLRLNSVLYEDSKNMITHFPQIPTSDHKHLPCTVPQRLFFDSECILVLLNFCSKLTVKILLLVKFKKDFDQWVMRRRLFYINKLLI